MSAAHLYTCLSIFLLYVCRCACPFITILKWQCRRNLFRVFLVCFPANKHMHVKMCREKRKSEQQRTNGRKADVGDKIARVHSFIRNSHAYTHTHSYMLNFFLHINEQSTALQVFHIFEVIFQWKLCLAASYLRKYTLCAHTNDIHFHVCVCAYSCMCKYARYVCQ